MVFGPLISDMMVKPFSDGGLFGSPNDFGLDYQDVSFTTSDGLELKGWLIPGATDKVIIQSHFGVQANRCGWKREGKGFMAMWDKDIPFLRQVQHLNKEKGYTVLMYDMRNHGESPLDTEVPWVSYGKREARDIVAAVKFIEDHEIYSGANIGLLSICMGASSSTFAFGDPDIDEADQLKNHPSIKAMVAIQPMTYKTFVKVMPMPGFMKPMADNVNNKRMKSTMSEVSFSPFVKDINVPTLVIQNMNDPMLDKESVEEYYKLVGVDEEQKEMKWVEAEKSRFAGYDLLGRDPEHFSYWFEKYV